MLRSEPVAYPLVTNGTLDLHLSRHQADKRRPMPRSGARPPAERASRLRAIAPVARVRVERKARPLRLLSVPTTRVRNDYAKKSS